MDINGLNSSYTEFLTGQVKNKQSENLKNQLKSDYSKATDEELMNACKQFEAYFVEQVFKGMEKTIPESQFQSSATSSLVDYYKENIIKEMATQSTERESIGLAQSMYEQMRRNYGMDQDASVKNKDENTDDK